MRINYLLITDSFGKTTKADFLNKTIVYSEKNSKGKTSLIRFLLHGLLFDIASTQFLPMNEYKVEIEIERNDQIITVSRAKTHVEIKEKNEVVGIYDLTKHIDKVTAQSYIFGLDGNEALLRNLLGSFFVDQDVGWSMTNHGNVTKSYNTFDISDFIASFSNRLALEAIESEIKNKNKEIKKYVALKDLSLLNEEKRIKTHIEFERPDDDLNQKKMSLIIRYNEEKNINSMVSKSLGNIDSFKQLINDFKIRIKHNGQDPFVLSVDDIDGFQSTSSMLEARLLESNIKLKNYEKEIRKVDQEILNNKRDVSVAEMSDKLISTIGELDQIKLETIVNELSEQKEKLIKEKKSIASNDNNVQVKLNSYICQMAKNIGVYDDYISKTKGILYSKESSRWSGAILNKIVLCYRYAYIMIIKEVFNIDMPFIIDSPGASELTEDNVKLIVEGVFSLLKTNQVIISTTLQSIKNDARFNKTILIEKALLDKSNY